MSRLLAMVCIVWAGLLSAQDFEFGAKTKVDLLVAPSVAKAASTIDVGLRLQMPKGYHTYWKNPGENGAPTTIEWALPKGISAGEIKWPVPEKVEWQEMFTYAYHGEILLIVPLMLAENLADGEYELKGKVKWLECEESCESGEAEVSAKLVVGTEASAGPHTATFEKARMQWPTRELLAGTQAEWDGAANAQGERRLKMTVPANATAKVEFLPFEGDSDTTPWKMAHASTFTRGAEAVTISKIFKSKSGQWPATLRGVLRFEENGKVRGHPVAFQPADGAAPEAGLDPFSADGFNPKGSEANAMLDHTQAIAGSEVWAGVQWKLREHWHLFWKDPGMPGLPPEFHWTLPEGITAGEIHWPKHKRMEILEHMGNVYEGEVMLLSPLTVGTGVKPGDYKIGLKVEWQECYKECEQHEKEFTLTLKVAAEAQPSKHASTIKEWRAKVPEAQLVNGNNKETSGGSTVPEDGSMSLLAILWSAFLGGIILNVMPCVLPVISMKILGFVQQSEEAPGRVAKLGVTYALGVMASFMVLAGMMIAAKQASGSAAWGMQMQNPTFNLVLMIVVMLVALNLFGVFEVTLGGGAMTKANKLANREGYLGAFFNGILATALATPCTAPFLATGMGAALTQTNGVIIAAMAAVGAGLAFPFVLFSFNPGWLKFLPKPGNWMVQFKQVMGFPMLAAAVWMLSFTGPMFGKTGILWLGVLLVVVALAAWVFGEFKQRAASQSLKPLLACVLLLAGGYGVAMEWGLDWKNRWTKKLDWQPWSTEAVAQAREEGRTVIVDFTADWCLNCKVTKAAALDVGPVVDKLNDLNGVALIGDWTKKDPAITKVLHRHKRAGVPLVLVYPPKGEPIILPPLMSSPGKVLEALDKAGRPSG